MTVVEKFWSRVDRSNGPDACWEWQASRDRRGYGQMWFDGRLQIASRIVLQLMGHEFLPGECALHRCDVPSCCNPAHLFVGTRKDNSDDMVKKGRERKAMGDKNASRKYPERRPRGASHGRARLTEEAVKEIMASPECGAALARRYGVARSTVNRIRRGETWAAQPLRIGNATA